MNELRVILAIAGILLIIGLYIWGMRSRTRAGGAADPAARKPAVFTGTADSFEREPPPEIEPPAGGTTEVRRIEPSMSTGSAPDSPSAGSRREPTWSAQDDSAPAPRHTARAGDTRIEPPLEREHEPDTDFEHEVAEPEVREPEPAPKKRPPQKIIAMRVIAVPSSHLDGARLKQALLAEGLEFGRYNIFHRLHADGRPVFSVASLREPGTFDVEAMATTQYPGVALFVVLPGPAAAADAIDEMVFTARALAAQLGGGLADERGVPFTAPGLGRLREEALEFERTAGTA